MYKKSRIIDDGSSSGILVSTSPYCWALDSINLLSIILIIALLRIGNGAIRIFFTTLRLVRAGLRVRRRFVGVLSSMIIRLMWCRLIVMGLLRIFSGVVSSEGGSSIGTLICSRKGGIGFWISIMILAILLVFLRLICILCKVLVFLRPSIIDCIQPKGPQENFLDLHHLFKYISSLEIRSLAWGFESIWWIPIPFPFQPIFFTKGHSLSY